MEQIKRGLRLFAEFFKIGCFTFGGGWAIVAQMEQEYVNRQKLITKDELLELVAVGRSTPGIMITNISLLFGYHVAGPFGGICTVLGIASPAEFEWNLNGGNLNRELSPVQIPRSNRRGKK